MWFILLSLGSPWGFSLLPHVPFATASMPAETFTCLLYQDPTTFLPHCYLLPCCKSFPSECLSTAQCLQITLDTACGHERTQAPPRGKTGWKMSHPLRSATCAGSSDRSRGWLSSYFSGVVMAMREEDKLIFSLRGSSDRTEWQFQWGRGRSWGWLGFLVWGSGWLTIFQMNCCNDFLISLFSSSFVLSSYIVMSPLWIEPFHDFILTAE